ncbi:MAG TPA: helix-turn-helix transcriptional regulator [Candidatus Dormibacteraeota bacterium]
MSAQAHQQLAVGEAAAMLGVSADTVRRLADSGRLKSSRATGGRRRIDGEDLARLMTESSPQRQERRRRSARNSFPGIVTHVTKDKVAAQVEVQAGPFRVVSLLTREAVDELGLEPGVRVVAQVKATNVVIELP